MLIGIDAGHGGKDPGAMNKEVELQEKNLTLDIAFRLQELLKYNEVDTFMTRTEDIFISLNNRAEMLNKAQVDYVISIHINSSDSGEPNYLSSHIIAKGGQAEQLAKKLQQQLVALMNWPDGGVRVSNFAMVRETKAPAVLTELGFISNAAAAEQLQKEETRRKLALALAKGVLSQAGKEFQQTNDGFTDIEGHWAKEEILWANQQGLITGVSADSFGPDQPITRAQLAVILKRFHDKLIDGI